MLYRKVLHQVRHPIAWMASWLPLMQMRDRIANRSVCSAAPHPCWGRFDRFWANQLPWMYSPPFHNSGPFVGWHHIVYYSWPRLLLDADTSGGGARFAPAAREAVLAARHYLTWK